LMEVTTLINLRSWRGWCSCGSPNLVNIGVSDAFEPVMSITPTQVVKVNSNPYN
jgi:hypothetical protein